MHVPDPVISLSVKPKDNKAQDNMGKALGRFVREDPTFRAGVDPESGETVISGMGELHLEVYVERMKREYNVRGRDGRAPGGLPRDDLPAGRVHTTHKKQTGGSGQFGRVAGYVEPLEDGAEDFEFVSEVRGGNDPDRVHPVGGEGLPAALDQGPPDRLPGDRASASCSTTASPTAWTRRTWPSRPRAQGVSARSTRGPSPSCSSR